jgi:hypothetical protein
MAGGDKPLDAVVLDTKVAEQGDSLFPTEGGLAGFQGKVVLSGYVANTFPADFQVSTEIHVSARDKAHVKDFDVEKQYKLTIEEV